MPVGPGEADAVAATRSTAAFNVRSAGVSRPCRPDSRYAVWVLPVTLPAAIPAVPPVRDRRPERDTASYRHGNVEATRRVAATVLATVPAARWFDQTRASTLSTLSGRDPAQLVPLPGVGVMTLADWLTTRVMSVAAHGLDVAISLDRPPWTTPAALTELTPVLLDLLGGPAPARLGWQSQTLLAVGTGRRQLTATERAALGPSQHRFPLLS